MIPRECEKIEKTLWVQKRRKVIFTNIKGTFYQFTYMLVYSFPQKVLKYFVSVQAFPQLLQNQTPP